MAATSRILYICRSLNASMLITYCEKPRFISLFSSGEYLKVELSSRWKLATWIPKLCCLGGSGGWSSRRVGGAADQNTKRYSTFSTLLVC